MNEFDDSDMWNREDEYGGAEEIYEEPDIYEDEEDSDEEDFYEQEVLEELFEDEEFFEGNEQSLMDSARIRLEQGRLYELLIKHDLFGDVEAAPEAIEAVQTEIKSFIMERLEILLGMRSEKETEIHVVKEASFNDMEVKALKMIAAKVTNGASKTEPEEEEEEYEPSPLKTVNKPVAKKGLNTLSTKKKVSTPKPVAKPVKKKKVAKPLRKKPKAAAVKKRRKIKKEMKEVGTAGKSITEVAKKDIKYLDSLKNMTMEQKAEVVEARHNRPKAPVSIDQDAVNSIYNQRMAMNTDANSITAILRAAKKV